MRVIIAPDSFKGSLSAMEACAAIAEGIRDAVPDADCTRVPISDGGEGLTDALLLAAGGEKRFAAVSDPLGRKVRACYARLRNDTAVVEMAQAAGLTLMGSKPDVMRATTYGVGELILRALQDGSKRLLLGLGGSATNDGGCGMAAALGVRFLDAKGDAFVPVGGTLNSIAAIDASALTPLLTGIKVTAMCDVSNPLLGKMGAAAVYAPQKGAGAKDVAALEHGLQHLCELWKRDLGTDGSTLAGGGAAGGMGAGVCCMLGGALVSGSQAVLEAVGFDALMENAELVITGEGSLDAQSASGKAVCGVARACQRTNVPCVALCGRVACEQQAARALGLSAAIAVSGKDEPLAQAMQNAHTNLRSAARNLMRWIVENGIESLRLA